MAEQNIDVALESTAQEILAKMDSAGGGSHGSAEFTTAGNHTWTCPEGVGMVYVIACGGSGGGGGGGGGTDCYSSSYKTAGAGGGSGYASDVVSAVLPVESDTVYNITIGSGGSGGTSGAKAPENTWDNRTKGVGGTGGTGGNTLFGNLLTAKGGLGGKGGQGGNCGSSSDDATNKAGAGGSGLKEVFIVKGIILSKISGSEGNKGVTDSPVASDSVNGYSGGTVATNVVGKTSGAGGSGGASYNSSSSRTDGSKGSAGSPGYMKIIW